MSKPANITKRDYMATAIAQGLLANHGSELERSFFQNNDKVILDSFAQFVYKIADAMVEEGE